LHERSILEVRCRGDRQLNAQLKVRTVNVLFALSYAFHRP